MVFLSSISGQSDCPLVAVYFFALSRQTSLSETHPRLGFLFPTCPLGNVSISNRALVAKKFHSGPLPPLSVSRSNRALVAKKNSSASFGNCFSRANSSYMYLNFVQVVNTRNSSALPTTTLHVASGTPKRKERSNNRSFLYYNQMHNYHAVPNIRK